MSIAYGIIKDKKRNEIEEKRKNDVIFKGIFFFFTFPLHPMFEERIICTDWGLHIFIQSMSTGVIYYR